MDYAHAVCEAAAVFSRLLFSQTYFLGCLAAIASVLISGSSNAQSAPGVIYATIDAPGLGVIGDEAWVTLRIRDYGNGPHVWGIDMRPSCNSSFAFVPESFSFNPAPDPWLPTNGDHIYDEQPMLPEGGRMTWLNIIVGEDAAGPTNGSLATFRLKRVAGGLGKLILKGSGVRTTCTDDGVLLGLCIPSPGPLYKPELIGWRSPRCQGSR